MAGFPAANGDPVTEADVKYCAEHGHAQHTVNGTVTGICPRCGEYDADPFGNRAFYTELFGLGEETVEEMTTTGEARELFPAVTFRNVEDAELVAEVLRRTADQEIAYLRSILGALKIQTAAREMGLPITVIAQGETNPLKIIKDKTTVLIRIGELLADVVVQLGGFYEESSDTESDSKYRKDLAEYAAGIAGYAGDVVTTIDALFAKTETGE